MFLGCDVTCQGLRNAAHAFPLALLTNPIGLSMILYCTMVK